MSSSKPPDTSRRRHELLDRNCTLKITSEDLATEITIIDHTLQRIHQAWHKLEITLKAGIYQIESRTGLTATRSTVILRPGQQTAIDIPAIKFASTIPLPETSTYDHNHYRCASSSVSCDEAVDGKSQFFLMIRAVGRLENKILNTFFRSITADVLDIAGNIVHKMVPLRWSGDNCYGATAHLSPGQYTVVIGGDNAAPIERPVVTINSHRTELYILARDVFSSRREVNSETISKLASVDLSTSSLVINSSPSFEHSIVEYRLQELATLSLASGKECIPTSTLTDILRGNHGNVTLKILCASILVSSGPVNDDVRAAIGRLRILLGASIPDVCALCWVAGIENPFAANGCDFPTLLKENWSHLLSAQATIPDLIRPHSLGAWASTRLHQGTCWMSWTGSVGERHNAHRGVTPAIPEGYKAVLAHYLLSDLADLSKHSAVLSVVAAKSSSSPQTANQRNDVKWRWRRKIKAEWFLLRADSALSKSYLAGVASRMQVPFPIVKELLDYCNNSSDTLFAQWVRAIVYKNDWHPIESPWNANRAAIRLYLLAESIGEENDIYQLLIRAIKSVVNEYAVGADGKLRQATYNQKLDGGSLTPVQILSTLSSLCALFGLNVNHDSSEALPDQINRYIDRYTPSPDDIRLLGNQSSLLKKENRDWFLDRITEPKYAISAYRRALTRFPEIRDAGFVLAVRAACNGGEDAVARICWTLISRAPTQSQAVWLADRLSEVALDDKVNIVLRTLLKQIHNSDTLSDVTIQLDALRVANNEYIPILHIADKAKGDTSADRPQKRVAVNNSTWEQLAQVVRSSFTPPILTAMLTNDQLPVLKLLNR